MLAAALSDSLWLAGQELSATVTLVSEDYCITPHLDYKLDDFTEKVPPPSNAGPISCHGAPQSADHLSVTAVHLQPKGGGAEFPPGAHPECQWSHKSAEHLTTSQLSSDTHLFCFSLLKRIATVSSFSSTVSSAPAPSPGTSHKVCYWYQNFNT